MKKRIPTITVAVAAYNEEKNIKYFLESVLVQVEGEFSIKNIWIFSDSSTDKTVEIVKSFNDKRIKVFVDNVRKGKSFRLNEIYSRLDTDILVQSDADVIFTNIDAIKNLIDPIIKERNVGMCGGNPKPLEAVTFTERAVNNTVYAYLPLRNSVRGGNNIFSADGRLLAYKKELVKQITVPQDMIANDAYTYFECLLAGYEYRFVREAVVSYRSPQNIKDQIAQCTRFKAARLRMYRYFPKNLVESEQNIPGNLILKNKLLQFIKDPIHCTYIFLINKHCERSAMKNERKMNALWKVAFTSKELF